MQSGSSLGVTTIICHLCVLIVVVAAIVCMMFRLIFSVAERMVRLQLLVVTVSGGDATADDTSGGGNQTGNKEGVV